MQSGSDPLFMIFEQHLFNALVEEETTDEFLNRVVKDYISELCTDGLIPANRISELEIDIREEVLEMLRKKTYGHYSLKEFRKAMKLSTSAQEHLKVKRRRTS
jgi:hypothetical protein